MATLYDACQYLIKSIEAQGLDQFKSRGALALETGFLISAIGPGDDDPQKMKALVDAARQLFQIEIPA